MSRGPSTFKQQDVTRAIRAAFAAGAERAKIKIGPIEIVAQKTVDGDAIGRADTDNEWDVPPAADLKQ
jgi:hypothetical protein